MTYEEEKVVDVLGIALHSTFIVVHEVIFDTFPSVQRST